MEPSPTLVGEARPPFPEMPVVEKQEPTGRPLVGEAPLPFPDVEPLTEQDAFGVVRDVQTTQARIADLTEQLMGAPSFTTLDPIWIERKTLLTELDEFFMALAEQGRTRDADFILLSMGANEEDIQRFFQAAEWVTPVTLGLPEAEPEILPEKRSHFVETWVEKQYPLRRIEQIGVANQIYEGLLDSDVIPEYQKDIMRQLGQVPAVYLKLSPEELAQLGVSLNEGDADYLRILQRTDSTWNYGYWESLLAEETPAPGGIIDQWRAGWGDVIHTTGAALRWLGPEGLGKRLSEAGAEISALEPPAEWQGMWHPNFWTRQLPRALPFTLSLMPAAVAGGAAGAAVGGAVGFGIFGKTVLGSIGAAALSRPIESALEAGSAYDQALQEGLSEDEASRAARQTFGLNMTLTGLDAAEFFLAFAPSPVRTGNRLLKYAMVAGRMVAVGLSEAGEEWLQDIIVRTRLNLPVKWDDDMKQAVALGFAMGVGLGSVGDAFTSIKTRVKDNLTPVLAKRFDKATQEAEAEGLTSEQSETKGFDAVAEDPEGRRIAEEAVEAERTVAQLREDEAFGVPNISDKQMTVGELGLVWDNLPTEVQASLSDIQGGRQAFPLFTVYNLARYIHNNLTVPGGKSALMRFARNSEFQKIHGFWASQRPIMTPAQADDMQRNLVSEERAEPVVFRLEPAPAARETLASREAREAAELEVYELEGEAVGLQESLRQDPVANYRVFIGQAPTGRKPKTGETFERKMAPMYRGLDWFISLREGRIPDYFTVKQAHLLNPPRMSLTQQMARTGKVRAEAALEDIAKELGMEASELIERIEGLRPTRRQIESLQRRAAAVEVPEAVAEPVPEQRPARVEPERPQETVPRGTLQHPYSAKGPEQAQTEISREFYDSIQESPLDVAATRYLHSGNIDDYIADMPAYSDVKLQALNDEVRENIAEAVELQNFIRGEIRAIEQFHREVQLSDEELEADQRTIEKRMADIAFLDLLIKKVKGGNAITIEDAVQLGMALRRTKGGKLVPAVRRSGFSANTDFAQYPFFRDVGLPSGMFMDTIRLHQAVDGGRFEGASQKYMLWPTQRTDLASKQFIDNGKGAVHDLAEKYDLLGFGKKKARQAAGDVIEYIGQVEAEMSAADLIRDIPEVKAFVADFTPAMQTNIVECAREARRFFDAMIDVQNRARSKRDQDTIPYRRNYRQWVAEMNIWSTLFGLKKQVKGVFDKAPMPDFIKPDAPFNPRALAREGGLANYELERDLVKLMYDYTVTASKDIFFTNIIQNTKIHTATLASLGYEKSAALLEAWASEVYAGVLPRLSRAVRTIIPEKAIRPAFWLRRQLTRAVFPLNWTWNAFVQTSSIALTIMRYGPVNTVMGLDYLVSPEARQDTRNLAYSAIVKGRRGGRMVYQDLGASVDRTLALEGSPLEKVENISNVLTNLIEDTLTGISVRAAYHYGEKMGYKGRALWEFASEGGAKTQSMYNFANIPGILRNKEAGTLVPFQTFALEVFNTVRELNIIGVRRVAGKAGAYETISATSPEGQATVHRRVFMLLRWVAAMVAINTVIDKAIGRKPWQLSSFIPFFSIIGAGLDSGNPWYYPMPVQYVAEWWDGVEAVLKYDNWTKLRTWAIRYHFLGGTQINRTLRGIEAVIHGEVTSVSGRQMFEVEPTEWLKAVALGPYGTEGGRAYIKDLKDKKGAWYEYLGFELPKRVSVAGEIEKVVAQMGDVQEDGSTADFGDVVSALRDIRRSVGDKRFLKADSPLIAGFLEAEAIREEYEAAAEAYLEANPELSGLPKEWQAEWRKADPEKDAHLAMYGFPGRLQTREAYDLVKTWTDELGIPMEHLDTWLPPEAIAQDYFDYVDIEAQFTGNSAEAKLFKLEHDAFYAWGMEVYGWVPGALDEENIEILTLQVEQRGLDEESAEYIVLDRKIDALKVGFAQGDLPKYIEYYDLPVKGFSQERYLKDDREFYAEMKSRLEWTTDIDFDLIPTEEVEAQYNEYLETDVGTPRLQYRQTHGDLDAWLVATGKVSKAASEYPEVTEERMAIATMPELLALQEKLEGLTEDSAAYATTERQIQGLESGISVALLPTYVDWYSEKRSGYEDDWFLIDNDVFHKAMLNQGIWKTERDFSKVPTREVFGLWEQYETLGEGRARSVFRELHPKLDNWLHVAKGYKLTTRELPESDYLAAY